MTGLRYPARGAGRPLSPSAVVAVVGLGILWLAAFTSAAGTGSLAVGLLITATVTSLSLGSMYLLGKASHGGDWGGGAVWEHGTGHRHVRFSINPRYPDGWRQWSIADRKQAYVPGQARRRAGAHRI